MVIKLCPQCKKEIPDSCKVWCSHDCRIVYNKAHKRPNAYKPKGTPNDLGACTRVRASTELGKRGEAKSENKKHYAEMYVLSKIGKLSDDFINIENKLKAAR